jgi:hypothetical protein
MFDPKFACARAGIPRRALRPFLGWRQSAIRVSAEPYLNVANLTHSDVWQMDILSDPQMADFPEIYK